MSRSTTAEQRATASPAAVAAAALGWLLLAALTVGRMRDDLTSTLHRDEAIAWTYANLPLGQIPGALEYDVNPPVYFMALHTWLTGGGNGEVFLRGLSVVAMLAAAGFAFDAARRLGGARAGWLAGVFVLLAPGSLALAGLARPYAIAFLLGMIALDAAIAMVRGARWPALAAFSVAGALLPLTHYWGGLLLAALLIALTATALLRDRRDLLLRAMIATGIALVALVPWAPTLASQVGNGPLAAHRVPDAFVLGMTLTRSAGGRMTAWVVVIGLAVLVWASWRARRRHPSAEREPLDAGHLLVVAATVAAVAIVVLMWLVSQVRPLFTPNYAAVVLAPLPVLIGVYLSRRWWTMVAVLTALALVAVPDFARSAFGQSEEDGYARGPEPAIGESIGATTVPGDVVLTSPGRVLAVRYYLGDERDYLTPIGRVHDGRFDYRNRVERLENVDPAIVVGRLEGRAAGTRVAVVHDVGLPIDHPYWIALDDAMDAIIADMRASARLQQVDSWRLDEPYEWIGVTVFEVADG